MRTEGSLATSVVMELSDGYLMTGRTLCTDNFYTNIELAHRLLNSDTHLLGTIRSNRRGLPKSIVNKKLKVGEVVAAQNPDGVVVMKWRHKRDVMLLSTKHDASLASTGRLNRQKETVHKPKAIIDYNKSKQGIDLSDQMSSYHCFLRRSVRWHHKVGMELLLGMSVVNALTIYNDLQKSAGEKALSITSFREKLCTQLIKLNSDQSLSEVPSNSSNRIEVRHCLQLTTRKESGKRSDRRKRRCCIGCYGEITETHGRQVAKRKATRVTTECVACPNRPAFCPECFSKHHGGI